MSKAADISLGRETVLATAARLVMALGGFAGVVVFARVLDRSVFGGVYVIYGIVRVVDRPMVGFGGAGQKRISERDAVKHEALGAQLAFNVAWIGLVAFGALLLAGHLRSYTGLEAAPLFLIAILATQSVYETMDRHLKGRGMIGAVTWIDTLRSYLTLPLQVALVLLGYGAVGVVFGLVGATLLTLPLIAYYLQARPAIPSWTTLRSLWAYARYYIPTTALSTLTSELDILLLAWLLVPGIAGDYKVAWTATMPAIYLAQVASTGLMSKASGRSARGEDVTADVQNTAAYASVLAIPLFFGAVALSEQVVTTLFGGEYAAAAPLLIGLALFRVVSTQTLQLRSVIDGLDHPEITLRLTTLTLVLNLGLGVVLVLWIGPIGVVIATVVAEVVRYFGYLRALRSLLDGVRVITRPVVEQAVAGALMYAAVAVVHRGYPVQSWIDLLVLVGFGTAVYAVVLLAISDHLRLTIRNVVSELA